MGHFRFCDFLGIVLHLVKSLSETNKYRNRKCLQLSTWAPRAAYHPWSKPRWTLLIAGIWWGSKRYAQLKTIEDERRAYEAKMKPIWDAEKAVKKEAANRESMLSLAAAAGVKVPADY